MDKYDYLAMFCVLKTQEEFRRDNRSWSRLHAIKLFMDMNRNEDNTFVFTLHEAKEYIDRANIQAFNDSHASVSDDQLPTYGVLHPSLANHPNKPN